MPLVRCNFPFDKLFKVEFYIDLNLTLPKFGVTCYLMNYPFTAVQHF